ncbi:MAG TPA: DUF3466 family protein [Longimicrobium sp.]|jgi:hypothetical protein
MKRFTFAVAAAASLAACADNPVTPEKAAECTAKASLTPAMSLLGAPARSRLLESPRTVVVIPIRATALTNDAVAAGTDGSGPASWSKTAGTRRLTGITTVGDYNPAGQAAGNNPGKLVRRESDGGVVAIGDSTASGDGAFGINSEGWVVGQQGNRAFFWTTCFGLKHLLPAPAPEVTITSRAVDINTRGDIAGYIERRHRINPSDPGRRATVWKAWSDERVEIAPPRHNHSEANAINDKGSVAGTVGNWGRGTQDRFPFFWTAEGGLVLIPVPDGSTWASATDINNNDEVVGWSRDSVTGSSHAWVWRRETGTERLPEIGQASSTALAINDWGDIIGMVGDQPVVWTWPENAHRWR